MPRIGRSRPASAYRPRTGKTGVFGDASLAATATLTAAAVRGALGDASLAATATLTASAQHTANATATTAAIATLTADAAVGPLIDAATVATATLTAAAIVTRHADASTAGTATLTAAAAVSANTGASLTAVATLTATAVVNRVATANLAATATLTAAMGTYATANTMVGFATRTATMVRTGPGVKTANGALPVTATLTATAVRGALADASLTATATLTADAVVSLHVPAETMAAVATLTATAHILGAPDPITPIERTYRIHSEDRTLIIPAENRVYRIHSEDRTLRAHRWDRDLLLPPGLVWPVDQLRLTANDSFGRGSLGSNWLVGANAPIIASNEVRAGASGPNSATTYYPMLWFTPFGTDDQSSAAVVVTAGLNPDATLGAGPIVRGNAGFDRVEMIATTTTVAIVTVIGGVRTTQVVEPFSVPNIATVRLQCNGHTYNAFVGSSATFPAASWYDYGHLIAIDSTTRLIGQVVSSAKDGGGTASYGWELDDWAGRDL